jgi:hypothetical protein
MTLDQIIEIADEAYGDGLIQTAHETGCEVGDTLASFIAIELRETYAASATDAEQLNEARRVMCAARREVQAVERAFEEAAETALEK